MIRRYRRLSSSSDESSYSLSMLGSNEHNVEKTDINGDRSNICILLFLYVLQGIPLGLIAAIPMLIQNRGASYKQQAEFSFAYWPFSLKLLWAPIVDSCYVRRFGRRKSWLVPCQYLIGAFMMILSYHVEHWLGGKDKVSNVPFLTLIFFVLNFLAATQDIAVDGWALTMLKRCNVSYASTCNTVGQTAGYFLGYVVFIAFESKDFCNKYLRSVPLDYGIITLPYFLWYCGVSFLIVTTIVAIFKREHHSSSKYNMNNVHDLNVYDSYKILFNMITMRPIQILAGILLTVKISFAASDAVMPLKLIEYGIPKEKLALLAIPIMPLQIILPFVVSRYTNGPRPLEIYITAIPYRIICASIATLITYFTPYIITKDFVPFYYYVLLLVNYALYQIALYCMFVAVMAFFARISDPMVGGTYMTFLNTLCNLGGNLANTSVLWLVDVLTWQECEIPNSVNTTLNKCLYQKGKDECRDIDEICQTIFDGYYVESIMCILYGIVWLILLRKWILHLQNLPNKDWLVTNIRRHSMVPKKER